MPEENRDSQTRSKRAAMGLPVVPWPTNPDREFNVGPLEQVPECVEENSKTYAEERGELLDRMAALRAMRRNYQSPSEPPERIALRREVEMEFHGASEDEINDMRADFGLHPYETKAERLAARQRD